MTGAKQLQTHYQIMQSHQTKLSVKTVYFGHLENISPCMSPVAQPQSAAIQVNSGAGGAGAGEGGRRRWKVEDEMLGEDEEGGRWRWHDEMVGGDSKRR